MGARPLMLFSGILVSTENKTRCFKMHVSYRKFNEPTLFPHCQSASLNASAQIAVLPMASSHAQVSNFF